MHAVMCPQGWNFLPIPYHRFYRLGEVWGISVYSSYILIWWFLTKCGEDLAFYL